MQIYFKTLVIGKADIATAIALKNKNGEFAGSDGRGRASSTNRTGNEEMKAIKRHIESFPKVESHYCRSSTNRCYLDPLLNIKKMNFLQKKVK